MPPPRVLSVGQCGYDSAQLAAFLTRDFGAEVLEADTAEEAIEALERVTVHLVLVNRVGDRDGASGLDLIRQIRARPALADLPLILVSNLADAQDQAVQAGACPGFGKSQLGTARAREAVASALAVGASKRPE